MREAAAAARLLVLAICGWRASGGYCARPATVSRLSRQRSNSSKFRRRRQPRASAIGCVAAGVIPRRDHVPGRAVAERERRRLKAGEYRFDSSDDADRRDRQARPRRRVRHQPHVSRRADDRGDGEDLRAARVRPASAFVAAAHDPSPIRDARSRARISKATCFPTPICCRDAAERHAGAHDGRALRARRHAGAARRPPQAQGLSVRQVVTLASIVEKETAQPDERPMVAAVYANRLRIGMALQCDPTVIYALQRAGRYDGNLRRDDLAFDSPYNTYRYRRPAARADRLAGQGVARGGGRIRPTRTSSISSAATTARTCSRGRWPSTTGTCRVPGALLPETQRRRARAVGAGALAQRSPHFSFCRSTSK